MRWPGHVAADPAGDALAKLNELSRQAEQTTEAMHSAQLDLNAKVAAQNAADKKHADDQAAVAAAKERLDTFQTAVNKLAAATYMGGRTDGMNAMMTADSPQQLIDKMALQRVLGTQVSVQMTSYRAAGEQAAKAEQASAEVRRRRQERGRTGRCGSGGPAEKAERVAGPDRRRQVARTSR